MRLLPLLVLAFSPIAARAQLPAGGGPPGPANGLSEWQPMGSSGGAIMHLVGGTSPTELTAFRVRYPTDFKTDSGPHYHFGTEHVTVLKGTIVVGFGDSLDYSKAKEYGRGSFIVIPAGTAHFEWFRGEVEAHVESIGPMQTVWIHHANGHPDKRGTS